MTKRQANTIIGGIVAIILLQITLGLLLCAGMRQAWRQSGMALAPPAAEAVTVVTDTPDPAQPAVILTLPVPAAAPNEPAQPATPDEPNATAAEGVVSAPAPEPQKIYDPVEVPRR